MNPTDVSQGLFSLLPSFSTLQTPLSAAGDAADSDFSSLLDGLTTALTASDQTVESLPPEGQPLPQQTAIDFTALQPAGLLAGIREATSASKRLAAELPGMEAIPESQQADDGATVLTLSGAAVPVGAAVRPLTSAATTQSPAVATADKAALVKGVVPGVVPGAGKALADGVAGDETAAEAELLNEGADADAQGRQVTRIKADNQSVNEPLRTATPSPAAMTDTQPAVVSVAVQPPAAQTEATVLGDSVLVTEAEAEQLEQQQQLTDNKERLEFGRDKERWAPAMGSRILTMVADNVQQAEIHLDPPELGSLEIKLQVNQDQASVQVQAQNPQVRDVLEANAQRLREALAEQGLELAGFDVSQQQTNQEGQSQGDGQGTDDNPAAEAAVLAAGESAGETVSPAQESRSLLDAYA
ncbi:flagellar hook-length control protein FliK [Bacterioplanoides pacificum]|uniref:Flagellar hook-length control protein FliK n=1 Tax=Bacterioplanoides pacificum TaxID=1171596 RepID=A0ABV7VW92_9GAMM